MTEGIRQRALEIAAAHNNDLPTTLARAEAYHDFLSGASAAGAAAKPAVKPAAPPAAATKPAAAKPAAAKPAAAPAGATKAPGGKYTQDQVRDMIRKVVAKDGMESAKGILNDEGGVQNVGALKPESYDAVYEACSQVLNESGGEAGGAVAEEFDPTA